MNNSKPLFIILFLLLVFVFTSFVMLLTDKRIENYVLFGFTLLLFTIVYCVTLLDLRITGNTVGIEQAKREIMQSRDEVSLLAQNIFKTAFILADGGSRFGGTPQEHKDKIREYMNTLDEYLNDDLNEEINEDIREINEAIQARNRPQE